MELIKSFANYIFEDYKFTEIKPPEFSTGTKLFGIDLLELFGFEMGGAHEELTYNARALIAFYIENFENDLETIINKLKYANLKFFLDEHKELITFNVDKIICYNNKTIALQISCKVQK
jgi:hypothetical protein